MEIAFTHKDKLRIIISIVVLVVGLLIIGVAFTPPFNPPQCEGNLTTDNSNCIIGANIGAGLVWLLGMAIAIVGSIIVAASLVFALANAKTRKPGMALLITAIVVGATVWACWYIFIGAPSIQKSRYQAEIRTRRANFVQYKGIPNIHSVTRKSDALTVKPATGNTNSVAIDLHNCSPGSAKVSYATGTTHFVFSGITKDKNLEGFNDSECILYIGKETVDQNWDGSLPVKCTSWPISNTLSENQLEFPVTNAGIQFSDILGNCQDLRTGVAPDL